MASQVFRLIALILLTGGVVSQAFAQQSANPSKTVWDGVYTEAQAERGREIVRTMCTGCHRADLSGGDNPPLRGSIFLGHWLEDRLKPLFLKLRKMPPRGETLPEATHLDVLAFLLESNGFPPGQKDLNVTDLDAVRLTAKDGEGGVPNYATVETVGCLERKNNDWI